jgi:hypothetical protein
VADVVPPITPEEAAPQADPAPGAVRGRRLRVAGIILAVVLLALVGIDRVTASPAVCSSCHEMQLRSKAWHGSPHANVSCVSCHTQPRAWYAYPLSIGDRLVLLGRDTMKHLGGDYLDPVDARPAGIAPMPDDVCLRCHDVNRKATSGFRILIDHPAHAQRNGSCVSCHIRTAHPLPQRSAAMSFMTQCLTCHGKPAYPKASTACGACHPSGYQLLPASHDKAWKARHGKVALADRKQCALCHKQGFCYGCHKVEMPHPKGWNTAAGHPAAAKQDRDVCYRCHPKSKDWCSMCHHQAYDPAKGSWVMQHFQVVRETCAAYCISRCHNPVNCARCHVSGAPQQ